MRRLTALGVGLLLGCLARPATPAAAPAPRESQPEPLSAPDLPSPDLPPSDELQHGEELRRTLSSLNAEAERVERLAASYAPPTFEQLTPEHRPAAFEERLPAFLAIAEAWPEEWEFAFVRMDCEEVPCLIEFDVRQFDHRTKFEDGQTVDTELGRAIRESLFATDVPIGSSIMSNMGIDQKTRIALWALPKDQMTPWGYHLTETTVRDRHSYVLPEAR